MGTEDVVGLGKQQVQKNNTDTALWRAQAAKTSLPLFCFLPGAQLRAGHWLADCHYGLESISEVRRGEQNRKWPPRREAETQGSKDRRLCRGGWQSSTPASVFYRVPGPERNSTIQITQPVFS